MRSRGSACTIIVCLLVLPSPSPRNCQTDTYEAAAESLASNQSAFVIVFTSVCTAMLSLCVVALLLPNVRVIGKQLRQKRALLLVMPSQFVGGLPHLRDIASRVLAAAEAEEGEGATRHHNLAM